MTTWRLTTAQLRRSARRLIPAGIAIMIATAFVAATVLVTTIVDQTARASVSERYSNATLVLTSADDGPAGFSPEQVATISAATGVTAASADSMYGSFVTSSDAPASAGPVSADVEAWQPGFPKQDALTFVVGGLPTGAGQVAIDEGTARRLADPTASYEHGYRGEGTPVHIDATGAAPFDATVSGVFRIKGDSAPLVLAAPQDLARPAADLAIRYTRVYLASSDPAATTAAIRALSVPGLQVRTVEEQTDVDLSRVIASIDVLTGFVYGFVAVALFVAGLVIANTFQVLIAARTRTLALLRCLGATRAQVRRSVLTEALVLGALASVAGLVLGSGLTQLALTLLAPTADLLLPRLITPDWLLLAAPLVLGIGVTLLAALLPARLATRVAPLEALRPQTTPTLAHHASKVRLGAGLLLIVAGAAIVALGAGTALSGLHADTTLGQLAAAILGGVLIVVGVLLTTVFWLPRLVRRLGLLLGRPGRDTRLASVNAVRNPRRTAATSVALIIAVGLVGLMGTGASVARAGLTEQLERHYPVDLAVTAVDYTSSQAGAQPLGKVALDADMVEQIRSLPGVELLVELRGGNPTALVDGQTTRIGVAGVDPDQVARVVSSRISDPLREGKALVTGTSPAQPPAPLQLRESATAVTSIETDDSIADVALPLPDALVPLNQLTAATDATSVYAVWLKLAPDANVSQLRDDIDAITGSTDRMHGEDGVAYDISGGFEQRQRYEAIIGTVLLVVLGLLGIAVIIALIGVTNTLALSIRERRQETALLRALGLTRRRVRRQLAIEGMLIAGIGSLAGIVLGVVLGWVGAATLLAPMGAPQFAIPWGWLAVLLIAATLAGALASVVPGRAATRIPPTQALAAE